VVGEQPIQANKRNEPVNATPKKLNESILRRLTNDALTTFLGGAERFEAAARPGLQLALTNEPIADMNMLVVGAGADTMEFRDMVNSCLERKLPFLVMIFPEADEAFNDISAELGLVYAVDFPMMVRDDLPLEPAGNPAVEVVCASSEDDADASAEVMASAYSMPKDSVLRALPASFFATPGADVYVARLNGEPAGTVTLTYHGETCGIWAMGTDTALQRGGIGLRLLSTAMVEARNSGVRRFFLGATPAGQRLYESLNFETVCKARVWVSGETHQA
jgi:ribosomal protein S18 acetylase RimI-like enzyme